MSERIRKLCALILVLIGAACMIYALVSWNRMDTVEEQGAVRPLPAAPEGQPEPAPSEGEVTPAPTEAGPKVEGGAEAPADPETRVETPAAPQGRADSPTVDPQTRRRAVELWIVAGLPLVFMAMVVIILLQRWLRPKPMRRTGPTDTTDLWVEAGKRLRIE